jgi:hypothetical protein
MSDINDPPIGERNTCPNHSESTDIDKMTPKQREKKQAMTSTHLGPRMAAEHA